MPVLKALIHLYWVATKDNDEDCSIFARSARTAANPGLHGTLQRLQKRPKKVLV
jgi:hypothetical protein